MSGDRLILLGSSRGDGNTAKVLDAGFGEGSWRDLAKYDIAAYEYAHDYPANDRFFDVVDLMIGASDIILATPVYWYAMSAQMKIFIDRWSDLVTVRKDLGRALAGRRVWMIATSADPELPPGFEIPFELTARYMNMTYAGGVLICCPDDELVRGADMETLMAFAATVKAQMGKSA